MLHDFGKNTHSLTPYAGAWSVFAHWMRTNVIGRSLCMRVCQVRLKLDEFVCLLHRWPCDATIAHMYIVITMLKRNEKWRIKSSEIMDGNHLKCSWTEFRKLCSKHLIGFNVNGCLYFVKCQKIMKNAPQNFPEPKIMSLNSECFFCPTASPKPQRLSSYLV